MSDELNAADSCERDPPHTVLYILVGIFHADYLNTFMNVIPAVNACSYHVCKVHTSGGFKTCLGLAL